jgi:glutamine cyclotransferase
MLRRALLPVWFLYAVAASTTANTPISGPAAAYKVVHVYPHDSQAFTQGLIYVDGHLYESTGLNGRSSLRMEDLSTGRVLQHYDLPAQYFGEGLTDWGSTLVQLTWTSHTGFVYDRFSFSPLRTFQYEGEGWGLTHDDKAAHHERRNFVPPLSGSQNFSGDPANPRHRRGRPIPSRI